MVETRRWPWLAALLSLLLFAGLGQAYAGRWRRALLFFIGELVCQALGLGILLHLGVATVNVALGFGLVLAYRACAAVDAARVTEGSHGVRAYVRWPIYLALVVGFLLTPRLARAHVAEAFRMPTRSMEGTIVPGAAVAVDVDPISML